MENGDAAGLGTSAVTPAASSGTSATAVAPAVSPAAGPVIAHGMAPGIGPEEPDIKKGNLLRKLLTVGFVQPTAAQNLLTFFGMK